MWANIASALNPLEQGLKPDDDIDLTSLSDRQRAESIRTRIETFKQVFLKVLLK